MTPPPFLLGCTILFWGWQSHLFSFAVPMALILEGARWVKWRWALSDKDFNRVTDFSTLLFVIAAIYIINQQSIDGLTTLFNWLPMLLFLLIAAQTYSTHGSIKLSSLFLSLRHYEAKGSLRATWRMSPSQRINLSYPYTMMCLLSTSIGPATWFFEGMCILVAWGLWSVRPQRYFAAVWVLRLAVAVILAYLAQWGIYRLQIQMEGVIISWFQEMFWADKDPYRQHTAIGDIGRLKQSDRILLRVDTPYPVLLREASYNVYFKTTWLAKPLNFTEVFPEHNETTWKLTVDSEFSNQKKPIHLNPKLIHIAAYLRKGKGMIALPHSTFQVSKLTVPIVQRNEFGAVKVENGPGLIKYTAHIGQNTPLDRSPTDNDLRLPPNEKDYLLELSNNLNLPRQSPQQVLNTLTTFFNQNFQYTLNLTASKSKINSPLENFLRDSRAGHCEYFATATALLLRTAGIPSRYATGYAAVEFSHLEDVYVVRQRHAHAWVLAYVNGRWQEFDTTPAVWVNLEEEMATWWEPVYDLGSWMVYGFSKWRWRESDSSNDWLLWLILPLSLVLIWRLYSREKVARSQKQPTNKTKTATAGANSAFYQIVQQLYAAGYIRQPGETLAAWLKRIGAAQMSEIDLQTMLTLHQRYRFDPAGISGQEQALLTTDVKAWLHSLKR